MNFWINRPFLPMFMEEFWRKVQETERDSVFIKPVEFENEVECTCKNDFTCEAHRA